MSKNVQEAIIEELLELIQPITHIASDDYHIIEYFASLGWDIDKIFQGGFSAINGSIDTINDVINEVKLLIQDPPESIADFISLTIKTAQSVEALVQLGISINQIATSSRNTHL